MSTRRRLLAGLAGTPLLGRAAWAAREADDVLRAGDQKGGTQSVMKAAGVLNGVPYRLEWSQFSAAAPLLEALNAGAVDLAFAGDAPATFAMAAGLQARIISPVRASGAGTAVMVPPDSSIRTVADLRGRSIAANRGSIAHALILAVAEAQGWSGPDIKFVNLLPNEAKTALSAGAVDAWCSWGVYVAQARLVDGAQVVVDGGREAVDKLVIPDRQQRRHRPAPRGVAGLLPPARRRAPLGGHAPGRVRPGAGRRNRGQPGECQKSGATYLPSLS